MCLKKIISSSIGHAPVAKLQEMLKKHFLILAAMVALAAVAMTQFTFTHTLRLR